MFSKVMFTTLFVRDQDEALDFYTKMLGFTKRFDNPGPEGRFLTMAFKGQGLDVLLWPGEAGRGHPKAGSPSISVPGPLFIQSDDLRKDFEVLQSLGLKFEEEPEDYLYGVRATVLDPSGNRVSLRQTRK